MQYVALVFDYACLGNDAELAGEVAARSFPAGAPIPAAPEQRAVVGGSEVSWKEARALDKVQSSQGGFLLYKLGQALHVLQASYFHQGVPDTPQLAPWFKCDPSLAWAHPRARGGWNSHAADLTLRWPAETLQMAKASYDALLRFPPIGSVVRQARPWEKVRPLLDGFIRAGTKAEKQAWFAAQGITDTSFLAGISLKDGATPFDLEWGGRRLPRLAALQSRQHFIDPVLLDFFGRFFSAWLTGDDFDAVVREFAGPAASAAAKAGSDAGVDRNDLAARLRLWRMRDHGAVADLAHTSQPLTARQQATVTSLARAPRALASHANAADAVFPLVTNGKDASPLLPFIVREAPASPRGQARAVAVAKLKHAPYDTLGVVAEQGDSGWKVIAIVSTVDH
jgi:hypothetical protein